MQRIEEHQAFLQLLVKTTVRQRIALLKTSSSQQRLAIAEIINNFLQGIIPTKPEEITQFIKSRYILRKLSRKGSRLNIAFIFKHGVLISDFLRVILPKLEL